MPEPGILLAHFEGSRGSRQTSIPKLRELLHRGEWQKQNNAVVGDGISCEARDCLDKQFDKQFGGFILTIGS